MLEDDKLMYHVQNRVSQWSEKLMVAHQRAERDVDELQRRIKETELIISQLDSNDSQHALYTQ